MAPPKSEMPTAPSAHAAIPAPALPTLMLPLAFIVGLALFGWLPPVDGNATLFAAFEGTSAVLFAWWAVLLLQCRASGRSISFAFLPRPQHYVQAVAHASIFVLWGFYWAPLRHAAPLIVAQIVFAYAFDMLLAWSRRDRYALGFGPFPIIFSMNLFLRFRDDWFYLQFVMVAIGLLAKELIRWKKDGRLTHIFNPSSFPLAVFSIGLILTGTTHLTWGPEIATTLFYPPHIFLFLFLIGLPGQLLFGVTTMTMSAAIATYVFGMAYFAMTGTYFFIDDYIPIAVFLGMHFLFTDPSTSPRSELGRIMFGITYGLGVVALYAGLDWIGAPTFYDKLLPVPFMNLAVRAIDRVAASKTLAWVNPARLGRGLTPIRRNLVYVTMWCAVFGLMSAQGLGDTHPGHYVPFWQNACDTNRYDACRVLANIEGKYCGDGSGWACNELGILMASGRLGATRPIRPVFERACQLRFAAGCANAGQSTAAGLVHADPSPSDYFLVLREGKGPLPDRTPLELLDRACRQGWATGCRDLGLMYQRGLDTPQDGGKGRLYLEKACTLGLKDACKMSKF